MFEEPALPILLYHKCPSNLEKHFEIIYNSNFRPVHLRDVKDYFKKPKELPKNKIVITFDDALKDFFDSAAPLLKRFDFPATLCVPTGFISNDSLHRKLDNWENNESSNNPIMTWDELREFKRLTTIEDKELIEFASHTVQHTNLNNIEFKEEELRYEIEYSKLTLITYLEIEDPIFFCFPYGGGEGKPLPEKLLREAGYAGALMVTGKNWSQYRIPRYQPENNDEDKLRKWLDEQKDIAHRFNTG